MRIGADHRKIVFCAESVGDVSDALIALFTVVIFAVLNIIRSAENDMIVDMVAVRVSSDHIGILAVQQFVSQILRNGKFLIINRVQQFFCLHCHISIRQYGIQHIIIYRITIQHFMKIIHNPIDTIIDHHTHAHIFEYANFLSL